MIAPRRHHRACRCEQHRPPKCTHRPTKMHDLGFYENGYWVDWDWWLCESCRTWLPRSSHVITITREEMTEEP